MLASWTDVQDRYPTEIPDDQITRVERLLADASAAVTNYTRQGFVQQQTTDRIRPIGTRIRLPKRPVVDVSSVGVIYNGDTIPLPGCWVWDGLNEILLLTQGQVINLSAAVTELFEFGTPVAEVTYTHGYDTIPEDVVAVVCSMVTRGLSAPGMGAFKSQTVGPFSGTLADTAIQGVMALTDAEKAALTRYRVSARTVELR